MATVLGQYGFRVFQNPARSLEPGVREAFRKAKLQDDIAFGRMPDYLIEGRIFDAYTSFFETAPQNVAKLIRSKISSGQSKRFIVSLRHNKLLNEGKIGLNEFIEALAYSTSAKEIIVMYESPHQELPVLLRVKPELELI